MCSAVYLAGRHIKKASSLNVYLKREISVNADLANISERKKIQDRTL